MDKYKCERGSACTCEANFPTPEGGLGGETSERFPHQYTI